MRRIVWILGAAIGLALAALYLWPPSLLGDPHVEVVKRKTSPDGKADALVQVVDGGATTSRAYCVFIVAKNGAPTEEGRMLTFDGPTLSRGEYGIVIDWKSPTELEASSASAKAFFEIRSSVSFGGSTYHVLRKR